MLLKPYTVLNDEQRDPFAIKHIGVVVDNNDPEKRKRLKIHIDPWDYLTDEDLPWVKQEGNGSVGCSPSESSHHIPEIGSEVTVYFKNKDSNDPVYTGVETTEANRCSLFDEGYPNSYGSKDSVGNYEIVNKETKTTVRQYASGTTVRAEDDGSYSIETSSGNYVRIDGNGEVRIQGPKVHMCADDDLEIRATRIAIVASNQLDMKSQGVSISGKTGVDINSGGNTTLGAKSSVNIKGADVTASNFKAAGACSAQIESILGGAIYNFQDGILVGQTGE